MCWTHISIRGKTISISFIGYPRKVQWFGCPEVLKIMATTRKPSFMIDTSISFSLSLICYGVVLKGLKTKNEMYCDTSSKSPTCYYFWHKSSMSSTFVAKTKIRSTKYFRLEYTVVPIQRIMCQFSRDFNVFQCDYLVFLL